MGRQICYVAISIRVESGSDEPDNVCKSLLYSPTGFIHKLQFSYLHRCYLYRLLTDHMFVIIMALPH